MTTTPAYITAMHRRHQALDTAVLNLVRELGPVSVEALRGRGGLPLNADATRMALLRLQAAGRVMSEPAPAPNQRWQWWRVVERGAG